MKYKRHGEFEMYHNFIRARNEVSGRKVYENTTERSVSKFKFDRIWPFDYEETKRTAISLQMALMPRSNG